LSRKHVLQDWVIEALVELGGSGSVVEVSQMVWEKHEDDLRSAGELFYTWQYDLRWAALKLRERGLLCPSPGRGSHPWRLAAVAN
jgi:hypothetical protein